MAPVNFPGRGARNWGASVVREIFAPLGGWLGPHSLLLPSGILINSNSQNTPCIPSLAPHPCGNFLQVTQGACEHCCSSQTPAWRRSYFANAPYVFPESGKKSVTDAWRSIWDVIILVLVLYPWCRRSRRVYGTAELEKMYCDLSRRIDPLKTIAPGSGMYGNEPDAHEPDWEGVFWVESYNELVKVKRR